MPDAGPILALRRLHPSGIPPVKTCRLRQLSSLRPTVQARQTPVSCATWIYRHGALTVAQGLAPNVNHIDTDGREHLDGTKGVRVQARVAIMAPGQQEAVVRIQPRCWCHETVLGIHKAVRAGRCSATRWRLCNVTRFDEHVKAACTSPSFRQPSTCRSNIHRKLPCHLE